MRVEAVPGGAVPSDVVAVGLPVFLHDDGPRPAVGADRLAEEAHLPSALDPSWCKRHGFTGKVGQTVVFRSAPPMGVPTSADGDGPRQDSPEPDVVLVGVGG